LFDVDFYIAQIPTEEKVIDSIAKERNFAYYQLGLIYKEKFKEYELSKTKFSTLLNNEPEARLVLPSKYNLFKIYEILGRTEEMERLKTEIIANYPDTRYAQILNNPELALAKDENSPESVYEATYKLFEEQQFAETISKSEEYITVFDGEAIVPKFELLKAYAMGRLYGFIEYKKAINAVAVNYANTAEGIQAQSILDNALKGLESNAFEDETTALSAKVVFEFTKPTAEELKTLKEAIEKAIDKMKYHNMYVSVDLYNPEKTFVVVHGLRSIETARAFTSLFEKPEQVELSRPFFGISTANYRILQIHKNLESYLTNQ
jgi:tetratricopeptide (TPR) repeat protein